MVALQFSNYAVVNELRKDLKSTELEKRDKEGNNLFHYACLSENPVQMMNVFHGLLKV